MAPNDGNWSRAVGSYAPSPAGNRAMTQANSDELAAVAQMVITPAMEGFGRLAADEVQPELSTEFHEK
jgi:hypothetical protein